MEHSSVGNICFSGCEFRARLDVVSLESKVLMMHHSKISQLYV